MNSLCVSLLNLLGGHGKWEEASREILSMRISVITAFGVRGRRTRTRSGWPGDFGIFFLDSCYVTLSQVEFPRMSES